MNGDIIAQRYAQALFDLGVEKGLDELEQYATVLLDLEKMLIASQELLNLFHSPIITVSEKQHVLLQLLQLIHANTSIQNFCLLLTEKERLPLFTQIVKHFRTLFDETRNIIHGQIVTAIRLDKKKQTEIVHSLEKQTTKKLILTFKVNTSILGGIILYVGDKVLDASLRSQLDTLRETIKKGV